jgi:hypothetical protein
MTPRGADDSMGVCVFERGFSRCQGRCNKQKVSSVLLGFCLVKKANSAERLEWLSCLKDHPLLATVVEIDSIAAAMNVSWDDDTFREVQYLRPSKSLATSTWTKHHHACMQRRARA